MSEKLLPCPFCGGEAMPAEVEQIEHSGWVGRIECGTCDAVFSTQYSANSPGKAGNEVIALWNRRELESASQPGGEPAAFISADHLAKAKVAPYLCRVEPTLRDGMGMVPIYTNSQPGGGEAEREAYEAWIADKGVSVTLDDAFYAGAAYQRREIE